MNPDVSPATLADTDNIDVNPREKRQRAWHLRDQATVDNYPCDGHKLLKPMPPRRAGTAASDRSITLLQDVDPTELRMGIFGSFNAWPSGDQELIRLLFRIAARMHELTVEHQVAYPTNLNLAPNALPPPYVPPTSVEKDVMYTGTEPAMTACREGILSIMTARYAKDKCTNAQNPSAQHSELQRASSMLLAALLEACQEDARFSHLKEMPYVKEDRLACNVITVDMSKIQFFVSARKNKRHHHHHQRVGNTGRATTF